MSWEEYEQGLLWDSKKPKVKDVPDPTRKTPEQLAQEARDGESAERAAERERNRS